MAKTFTIEERIAHFLRLAEDKGATQAERDTASEQAEKLMLKHAIDRAMLAGVGEQKDEEIVIGRIVVKGGSGTYAWHLMAGMVAVANAMGLKGYFEDFSSVKAAYTRMHKINGEMVEVKGPHLLIAFAGYESDVREVEQLITSLLVQATVAMKVWWKQYPLAGMLDRQEGYHARCEFLRSFGSGASTRIRENRKVEVDSTPGAALVLVSREEKVQDWANANLGLATKGQRRMSSPHGRADGHAAGYSAAAGGGQAKVSAGSRGAIGR